MYAVLPLQHIHSSPLLAIPTAACPTLHATYLPLSPQARASDAEKHLVDAESRLGVAERRVRDVEGQASDLTYKWREAERARQEAEAAARAAEAAAKQVGCCWWGG